MNYITEVVTYLSSCLGFFIVLYFNNGQRNNKLELISFAIGFITPLLLTGILVLNNELQHTSNFLTDVIFSVGVGIILGIFGGMSGHYFHYYFPLKDKK
ncbi:MAG: hypothetical protein QM500_12720 [Methylococcales bacterium]